MALELDKNYKHIMSSRTYGAPIWDIWGKENNNVDLYRNGTDPVSVFDRSVVKSVKWNPFESSSLTHDYSNIAKDFYILKASTNSNIKSRWQHVINWLK